jgi:hypothetical protein
MAMYVKANSFDMPERFLYNPRVPFFRGRNNFLHELVILAEIR